MIGMNSNEIEKIQRKEKVGAAESYSYCLGSHKRKKLEFIMDSSIVLRN